MNLLTIITGARAKLTQLRDRLQMQYENRNWWRYNPCDIGAMSFLRGMHEPLVMLTSRCACCTGARIVMAALAGVLLPTFTMAALALMAFLMVVYGAAAAFDDQAQPPESQPDPDSEPSSIPPLDLGDVVQTTGGDPKP